MHTFTDRFISRPDDLRFLKDAMMGPNAMRLAEEMASFLNINPNMRVLDLGCGCGLSSFLLAEKYGATVFAADLWISPTENYQRFRSLGIEDKVIPVFVDASKGLPFADGYFDLLFSVDAYHYFGDAPQMLSSLAAHVKQGGHIAVAVPGLKYEFGKNIPLEMQPFWNADTARTLHSLDWWQDLWNREKSIEICDCREMACCEQAWGEWLTASHPVVAHDIEMMRAESGNYFNLIQLIAKVL